MISVIVLDIEGTTTPISFVYDVLFPYARTHLREFVDDPKNAEAVAEAARLIGEEDAAGPAEAGRHDRSLGPPEGGHYRNEGGPSSVGGASSVVSGFSRTVERMMDEDRKSPGLKLLQGLIWRDGYRTGALRGEVFDDVPPALRRWRGEDVVVAIYSSGSVLAQRLLFGSTKHGDLTRFITRFFDTGVGPKTASESYLRIAAELGYPTERMLFVSDVTTELDAAAAAGYQVTLCIRPGNKPRSGHQYSVIKTLEEIL